MRHRIAGNKLGRNQTLRKATVRDIAKATLLRQRITTTKAKAKEARKVVDKLITLGKGGTLAHKRRAFSILNDHKLVSRLFNRTTPLFKNRNGGYTRIILLSNRRGDNAQLAFLELTEKEDIIVSKPKSTATAKKEKVAPTAKAEGQPGEAPKDKKAEKKDTKKGDKKEEKEESIKKAEKTKESPRQPAPTKDVKKEAPKKEEKPKTKFKGIRKFFRRKST